MLAIYRRHNPRRCNHTSRKDKRCKCMIWIEGTTDDGRTMKRQSLKTRLWADAERKKTRINEAAVVFGKPLKEVTDEFEADVKRRGLSSNLQQKCKRLFKRINDFAEQKGLQQIQAWTTSDARKFDATQMMKSHRMRDTFACEALLAGAPIEEVSKMLGHRSIKTTEKYYGAWVKKRQEQMEERFERIWANDPTELPYNSGTTVN